MKNIQYKILLGFAALAVFTSCDNERGYADYDPGQNENLEVAGEWNVIGYETDGVTPAYGGSYLHYRTYDAETTGDNDFYLEELDPFFELLTKVQNNNGSFSGATDAPELVTGGTVTVTNGKVIKGGGRSFSGAVVDSIYFEAEFDWDPGYIYKFGGHGRSGFLEDDL
ncbi:MAG: hypothetical protein IR153_07965 [Flavobacterium sp.]|nr:hypothetical protein [Flavobacterium sp.]